MVHLDLVLNIFVRVTAFAQLFGENFGLLNDELAIIQLSII